MKFIKLLAMAVLFAFSASVFAQDPIPNPDIVVEILDCGYEADLCDDGDCQVSADGFMVVVKAIGFSSAENLEASGGLTVTQAPKDDEIEWDVSWIVDCTDRTITYARWVAPWRLCSPGRSVQEQLTYVVDIGPLEVPKDGVEVTLEACLDDHDDDYSVPSCAKVEHLWIMPE